MGKKQLAMILGVLAVVLIGALVFLYYQVKEAGDMWPHENAPGSLTFENGRLRNEIASLQQEVAKIPDAKERLEVIQVEYDLATRVLPRESSPDQLIAAIRTKAEHSGVKPNRLTPNVGRGGGGRRGGGSQAFEEWSFTLEITGSYDKIATFVNNMEEFSSSDASRTGSEKRFFQVSSIDITSEQMGMAGLGGSSPESVLGHRCTLVMQTYRYTGTDE